MDAIELIKTEARLLGGYCLLILKIQGICLSINIYDKYEWCYRLNLSRELQRLMQERFPLPVCGTLGGWQDLQEAA